MFFGIVVRIDTVLSFMYDMFVRRMGLFDHGYGLRLLELGSCPYRYCFKLHVRCVRLVRDSGGKDVFRYTGWLGGRCIEGGG